MPSSDCCAFGVFSTKGAEEKWAKGVADHVECLILLRVGDLFPIGSAAWEAAFLRAIKEYDRGSVDQLSSENPITYCGILISQSLDRIISVSLKEFYHKLIPLGSLDMLKGGRFIINEAKRRKLAKSFVAGCLWLVQCRYDLCFPACQLAPDVIGAISCPEKMKKFTSDTLRTLSRISKYHSDICFRNFLNAS